MLRRAAQVSLLALVLATATSCDMAGDRAPSSEIPVAALQERVRQSLADLDRARAALPSDPEAAASHLERSSLELRRLDEYYLPLLAAREQVVAAVDALGRDAAGAGAAVDSAEALLLGIIRGHGRHLEREMRGPLERLEDARAALAAGDVEEARRVLADLRDHLSSIFHRGGLVLQGSELEAGSGSARD